MCVTQHFIQCRTAIQHVCDCVYICICVYIHTDLARGYLSHVITPMMLYSVLCWTINLFQIEIEIECLTKVQIGAVSGDIPRTLTPPRGFLGEVLPKGLILVGRCSLIPLIHLLQKRDIPGRTLGHTLKRQFALWVTLLKLAFCLLEFFWYGASINNCAAEFIPKQRGFLLLLSSFPKGSWPFLEVVSSLPQVSTYLAIAIILLSWLMANWSCPTVNTDFLMCLATSCWSASSDRLQALNFFDSLTRRLSSFSTFEREYFSNKPCAQLSRVLGTVAPSASGKQFFITLAMSL